jgi:hypothetical protein
VSQIPDLRQDPEFDTVWRYRVCFHVFPDGFFLVGDPGDGHALIEEAARDHLARFPGLELKETEGQFVFEPEIGVIEQWPVDRHELQAPDWLNGALCEPVREAVIAHYEETGPAPLAKPELSGLAEEPPSPQAADVSAPELER